MHEEEEEEEQEDGIGSQVPQSPKVPQMAPGLQSKSPPFFSPSEDLRPMTLLSWGAPVPMWELGREGHEKGKIDG